MKKNAGFTLIELVIVIIVLGILAATAVPKFINLQDDAKESALKGAEAAIHSAANIVYSKAAIDGVEGEKDSEVKDGSVTIQTVYGYPEAIDSGIYNAIELSGFKHKANAGTPKTMTFWQGDASTAPSTCIITYTEATSGARYSVSTNNTCS